MSENQLRQGSRAPKLANVLKASNKPVASPVRPDPRSPRSGAQGATNAPQYEASGPGLELCQPNKQTSFVVNSAANRKILKVPDLKVTIKGSAAVKTTVKERADGALEVWYTAPMSGEYRVMLAIGTQQIPGSPFKVFCQLPRACEINSDIDLNGGYGFIGERFEARLVCKDQFGQPFQGKVDVAANVLDGKTFLCGADVEEIEPGDYEISFLPEISSTYGLEVILDGNRMLQGSPFQIRVRTDETIPSKCKLYGSQLTQGVAGETLKFSIQAVDGKNNARVVGGDPFEVEIAGPPGASPKVEIKDNMNGTYDVRWSTNLAGVYLVKAILEDVIVASGPVSCHVQATKLDPSKCTCTGKGISRAQAGATSEFKITAADRFGNTRTTGGDCFNVLIHRAGCSGKSAPIKGTVEDSGNGHYAVRYVLTVTGTYEVYVFSAENKEEVKGSPFICQVEPGAIDAKSSRVFGPGLSAVQLGRQSQVLVELADRWGNKVFATPVFDPSVIQIDVRGPGAVTVAPGPLQNGIQTYHYLAKLPGSYVISATVDGQHLCDSPTTVVASTAEACPELCEVRGAPLELHTTAGVTADFTIVAKDAKAIQKSLGGDIFTVTWQQLGDKSVVTTGKVEDLGIGEYTGRFFAMNAGTYSVSVTHKGTNIAGSPFTAVVRPAAIESSSCVVMGEGMHKASCGHKAVFIIKPRDKFSNAVPIDNLNHFNVSITGPQPIDTHLSESGEDKSELLVSYTPIISGTYTVAATFKGCNIQGSTWQLQVVPDTGKAVHSRFITMPDSFTAGQSGAIAVCVYDVHGNATYGGDHVVMEVDSVSEGATKLTVTDNNDGTYSATYQPLKSGFVTLRVFVHGELLDVPHTIPVHAAPLNALLPLTPGPWKCIAGDKTTFLIRGKDEFGNYVTQGGALVEAKILLQTISAGLQELGASVQDEGDGTYAVSCLVNVASEFKVVVSLARNLSVSATVMGACVPGPVCPAKCQVLHVDHKAIAGNDGFLHLMRCDKFGNKLGDSNGLLPISAHATGPGNMTVQVMEQMDGTVKLRYCAIKSGNYRLHVSSSTTGEAFAGGPVEIAVTPSTVLPEHCEARLSDKCHKNRHIIAGCSVDVEVLFKDKYSNMVSATQNFPVRIIADGPEEVAFLYDDGTYRACLTKCGGYLVHVTVGDVGLSTWPQTLQVLADNSAANKCYLTGMPTTDVKIGEPVTMLIHTVDAYGNARGFGGEDVSVDLVGPEGSAVTSAWVVDNDNGSYAVRFKLDKQGRWAVKPRVNGNYLKPEGFEVHAVSAALNAMEYVLHGVPKTGVVAGSVTTMMVAPETPGVKVTGKEVFTAVLTGPAGNQMHVPLMVLEDRSGFKLDVHWLMAGQHTLSVILDGQDLLGSPCKVAVSAQTVCLTNCMFQGLAVQPAKAGDKVGFTILARDANGNSITQGGAKFGVKVVQADSSTLEGTVTDNLDGSYDGSYSVTKAGPYQVHVSLQGGSGSVVQDGLCVPSRCIASQCIVADKPVHTAAGSLNEARILCKDRYGNSITTSSDDGLPLSVSTNSDALVVSCHAGPDGGMLIRYSSTVAGSYLLSFFDAATNESAPGSPFTVDVSPGPVEPRLCAARMDADLANLRAGEPVGVAVEARDCYGNLVSKDVVSQMVVKAVGPAEVPFKADGSARLAGVPTVAGLYTLSVSVNGIMLPGWPQVFEVLPSLSGPLRCTMAGDALHGVTCNMPQTVTIRIQDQYGNQRLSGGDIVELLIRGPAGEQQVVQASDCGTGVYNTEICVKASGIWKLIPKINGSVMNDAAREFVASWPSITGADCIITDAGLGRVITCGDPCMVHLAPKEIKAGRRFSGNEAIVATLLGPTGKTYNVPAVLDKTTGCYVVAVKTQMSGTYTVNISIANTPVPGCPLVLEAIPGKVYLPACICTGLGATKCTAGAPATFTILASDTYGNKLQQGGTPFKVNILEDGAKPSSAMVVDNNDGSYAVTYTLKRAGKFQLSVGLEGSDKTTVLDAECFPGAAVGRHCVVEKFTDQLTAGATGQLKLVRYDRFSNRVSTSVGQSPVKASAEGPQPLKISVAEQGDGSLLCSYTPLTAGHYILHLQCGEGNEDTVPASLKVEVGPATVAVSSCRAWFEGVAAAGATAGTPVALAVQLQDVYGNTLDEPDSAGVEVEAVAPVPVKFDRKDKGMYRASLTKAGCYLVVVRVAGQVLNDWPKLLYVQPGPAFAPTCTVSGSGLHQMLCGQVSRVSLQARDCYGNVRTSGSDRVQLKVTSSASSAAERGEVIDNGDGTYRLEVTVETPGSWCLMPSVNGQPVKPDGFVVEAVHGPLTAQECVVNTGGLSLLCGSKDTIIVKPKGAAESGRRVTGSENITACIVGPSGLKSSVPVKLMSGCEGYSIDVTWREVGAHVLEVYKDSAHIVGSPEHLTTLPGPLAAHACTVSDYRNSSGVLELTIEGRDELNNPCKLPADRVQLSAVPSTSLDNIQLTGSEEGNSVQIRAVVKERGNFNVVVNGRSLFPTDRALQWSGGRDTLAQALRPLLDGVALSVAGKPCTVLFTLANATGLPEIAATLKMHEGSSVVDAPDKPVVKPRVDGLYEIAFAVKKAGSYQLHTWVKDDPLLCCQVGVAISPGTVSPPHCVVDAQELTTCVAGQACKAVVHRMDRYGNRVPDSNYGFRMSAAGPGPVVLDTIELQPGVTQFTIKARTAGKYTLHLQSQATGEAVGQGPFEVEVVAGPVSGSSSSYSITGYSGRSISTIRAGQELALTLDARDKYGNATVVRPNQVTAVAHGPQGIVEFKWKSSANSGQASVSAVITDAGTYHLEVKMLDHVSRSWHKVAADDTRRTIVVRPAQLSPSHTTLTEIPEVVMAGIPSELYIYPTDRFGNKGATGGTFAVELNDGKNTIPCQVFGSTDENSSVAKILASVTGRYKVRISVVAGDSRMLLHEADIKVVEAACSADKSYITGHWPPSGPVANVAAGFVIQACDKYGNQRTRGGDRFIVDILGVPSQSIVTVDRGDGAYAVQYTVPTEGNFRVSVMLEGHHIQGSPTSLTVFRDVVGMANLELERRMSTTVSHLRRGIANARQLHASLRAEAAAMEQIIPVLVEGTRNGIYEALKQQDVLLAETRAAYQREAQERRRLHNLVQELRGNIRVYVRVKPLTKDEEECGMYSVLKCHDDHRITCMAQGSAKQFEFDRVFGQDSTQLQIFDDVSQLVHSALDGYNVCIFAYGQTGAGKTFTMEGSKDNPGINYRAMRELFRSINEEHTADYTHHITVNIVEIYNEMVHDLLDADGKKEKELQKHPSGNGFVVVDLTETEVTTPDQIFGIMAQGFEHRATGCHDVNAHSSRSHCLLIINVVASNLATGITTRGKLTLCDLAGSERINKTHATGLTLTEAQNINRSLLELGNVISALMQQTSHVPYRNSKLTMLLQDSLGGDSKALMFCNLSPASVHVTETLSSLAFASKVSNVVLKTPQKRFEDAANQKKPLLNRASKRGSTMSNIPSLS